MSTDFVGAFRAAGLKPPVRSLLDTDFYKFTMGNLIWQKYRDVEVTFKLIVRDLSVPVHEIIPQAFLVKCLDHARTLKLDYTDLSYLRGMRVYGANMFCEGYTEFLETFKLPPYRLRKGKDGYELTFSGPWVEVSMWETIALAIISELYYRARMENMTDLDLDILYSRAKDRIYSKLEKLQRHPDIRFADFGQRRRHSFLWQQWVLKLCREMMGKQFTGTSNTWMAARHKVMPIGTNAHELPMVLAALAEDDEQLRQSQYEILPQWEALYGSGLRVFLPDTFGTEQFLESAPESLAHEWRGMRQDSGNPIRIGHRYIEFLRRHGVDPKEKLIIFSDGLDVDPMIQLYEEFAGQVGIGFGWGTLLTNDFALCYPRDPLFRPFSMVCKVVLANGRPCVKLSDNIHKATGPAEEIARYTRIFGSAGRSAEAVIV
ncbi:MAG: nicotinate phosphoribosyltransferase [bacterium]|nr:nicotinate phosphoribosyltransferase [bacterium]